MADSTRWPELLAYLGARRPELVQRFVGATPEQLHALFDRSPSPVPQAVLDLYAGVGQDDGGYLPLGRIFPLALHEQLEDMDEAVVAGRFLRVALVIDDSGIGDADLYVDLASSDGYDAPLLQVCDPWDGRKPHLLCHSLLSKLIQRAHEVADLEPRAELGCLWRAIPREALPEYVEAFDRLAHRMGLQEALRCRPELRCGTLQHGALMFDALGPGIPLGTAPGTDVLPTHLAVWLWFATDKPEFFHDLREQIADHMPPLPQLLVRETISDDS